VTLVVVIEGGSGPGGGLYACLPHARARLGHRDSPPGLEAAVTAMEARAT